MAAPAFVALACSAGQAAAAACGVRFDCAWKFGSLKPSRNLDPVGIAPLTVVAPHTIGTNSIPVFAPVRCRLQLYHQLTAGKNEAPGATLAAIPRLQTREAVPPAPPAPVPAAP